MPISSIIAVAVIVGASAVAGWIPLAYAEGTTMPAGQSKSVTQAAGQLKTDATQTTKDAQALDVEKTSKGAGQVKQDAKDLHQSAKDTMKNPLGTTSK